MDSNEQFMARHLDKYDMLGPNPFDESVGQKVPVKIGSITVGQAEILNGTGKIRIVMNNGGITYGQL